MKKTLAILLLCSCATAQTTIAPSKIISPQINKRIYVEGSKYQLTQSGIQQAFTDACAINNGLTPGTTVYLPPMLLTVATGFTITCPLHIQGAGIAQTTITATSGKLFTISPSANFSQNQEWEFSHGYWLASADDVIFQDTTSGFGITRLYIHDSEIQSGSVTGWGFSMKSPSIANASFDIQISNNHFLSGINFIGLSGFGAADGLLITHNEFNEASTSTNPCINLNSMAGAAQWTVSHNIGGCKGGFIVSTGTTECKILYNQTEQVTGTGSANGAVIDLQGTAYTIGGCEIKGNNINQHAQASIGLRIDHASNVDIDSNFFGGSAGETGIVNTANASGTVFKWNVFSGVTTNISDSGTNSHTMPFLDSLDNIWTLPGAFAGPNTSTVVGQLTMNKAITISRISGRMFNGTLTGCSPFPTVTISDGSNTCTMTWLTGAAIVDAVPTGVCSFAAGAVLTAQSNAGTGCTGTPSQWTGYAQYRTTAQ